MESDGTVRSIYLHHDGYTEAALKTLVESYATPEAVGALLDLGDLDVLAPTTDDCTAFGRDRGEDPERVAAEDHPVASWPDTGQEYEYLFDPIFRTWSYRSLYANVVWTNA